MILTPSQSALYGVLQDLTRIGALCPDKVGLAAMSGIEETSVWDALDGLRAKDLVSVHHVKHRGRIVTDQATGMSTSNFQEIRPSPDDISRFYRPGDGVPCWKCGVRPDVPCNHRRLV